MAERRPLTAGLKQTPAPLSEAEKKFLYGDKLKEEKLPSKDTDAKRAAKADDQDGMRRISARIRDDYWVALKRASLERQLAGEVPNNMQDFLEEALGLWLRKHGYLK